MRRTRLILSAVTVCLLMQAGCESDPTAPDRRPPGNTPVDPPKEVIEIAVEALAPTTITGMVATLASVVPAVRLTNAKNGQPLPGVVVDFIDGGEGVLDSMHTKTDSNGVASAIRWRLSTRAGLEKIRIYVNGRLQGVSFSAQVSPDVFRRLARRDQNELVDIAGGTINEVAVVAQDRFDNPIPGIAIAFAVTGGKGSTDTPSAVTGSDGVATVRRWILDASDSVNQLTATAGEVEPLRVRAVGLSPTSIKWYKLERFERNSWVGTLAQYAIAEARIGVTSFDGCKCSKRQGYVIEEMYFLPSPWRWESEFRFAGTYSAEGLTFGSENVWPWGVASVKDDYLIIDRSDPWGDFNVFWVYRAENPKP